MDEKTVMLSGLPLTCNPVKMKLRFESECKVRIVRIKVGSTHTEVTLPSKKDCETFCNNLPPKITFGNEEHKLEILDGRPLSVEPETKPVLPKPAVKNSFVTRQSWSSLNKLPCCECGLLVQPTNKGITPQELKEYFEANTPSCGGPVETVIPMIDGILVIFKEADVAQRVWNHRPHRINKKSVVVFLKTVPPKYPQKLIVKPHETALNKEKLRLLLDQSSKDGSLAKIQTTMKGAFFVTLDDTVGESTIQNIVDHIRRSTPTIDISFLHKTDCLIVKNSPPLDMSDHEIKTFFENSAWSGGGSVTRIDRVENGHLLIYFTSYKDAGAVFDKSKKQELSVFGSILKIHQHFHNIHECKLEKPNQLDDLIEPWLDNEDSHASSDAVDLTRNTVMFENMGPDLAKFFHAKQEHVKILIHHMKDQADIKTSPKGFEVSFNAENDGDQKTIISQIHKFLEDYGVEKVRVNDETTRQVIEEEFSDESNKGDVYFWWAEPEKGNLIITGLKSEVASYVEWLQRSPTTFRLNLGRITVRWLIETKTLEQLQKIHKAIAGCTEDHVLIFRDGDKFHQAKRAVEQYTTKLKRENFRAEREDFLSFLSDAKTNSKIAENVTEIFLSHNIPAILVVCDGNVSIFSPSDCLENATKLLNKELTLDESFESNRIAGRNQSKLAAAWKKIFCFMAEGRLKRITKEDGVSLVGFRDFVTCARSELAKCGESYKALIRMEEGAIQHIVTYKQDFSVLCKSYKVFNVTSQLGIVLTGEKTDVESVSKVLEGIKKDIVKETADIKHPKGAGFLSSKDGIDLLSMVGKATSSTIIVRPKTPFQPEVSGVAFNTTKRLAPPVSVSIGLLTVSLRKGSMTEETNDMIVNSVGPSFDLSRGTISKAILDEGGLSLQSELADSKHNHIRVTSGGNLNCQKIIHVVLPSDSHAMRKFLVEILEKADELQARSISIPAIGAGDFQDSRAIAQVMHQSIQNFAKRPESIKNLKKMDIIFFNDYQLREFKEEFSALNQDLREENDGRGSFLGSLFTDPVTTVRNFFLPESLPKTKNIEDLKFQALEDSKTKIIGQLTVSVRQGDITEEKSDAIVNSTNCNFDLSQGMVSTRIIFKGGDSIQAEVLSAKGKAIRVTRGGNLKCKKIIHVDATRDMGKIGQSIGDILENAESHHCSSVSIPAIGTGNLHLSEREVAKIMLKAVEGFEQSHPTLKYLAKVDFVIYDRDQMKNFRDAFFGDDQACANASAVVKTDVIAEVYYFETGRGKEPLKRLEEALDEKFGYPLSEAIIGKLTPEKQCYLQECERRYQVEISRCDKYYLIKGTKEDASSARSAIEGMAIKQPLKNEVYIWEYEDRPSHWVQFGDSECKELERLYRKYQKDQKQATVFIAFEREQVSIDFKEKKMGKKINIRWFLKGVSNSTEQNVQQNSGVQWPKEFR